jgi:hypothetical protein
MSRTVSSVPLNSKVPERIQRQKIKHEAIDLAWTTARMSADLFDVFGTPDEVPSRDQLDERWTITPENPVLITKRQPRQVASSNGEILFDADEAEAEDDFGDFEDVKATSLHERSSTIEEMNAITTPFVPPVSEPFNLLDLEDEHIPIFTGANRLSPSLLVWLSERVSNNGLLAARI